jgi:hypothetical protein
MPFPCGPIRARKIAYEKQPKGEGEEGQRSQQSDEKDDGRQSQKERVGDEEFCY